MGVPNAAWHECVCVKYANDDTRSSEWNHEATTRCLLWSLMCPGVCGCDYALHNVHCDVFDGTIHSRNVGPPMHPCRYVVWNRYCDAPYALHQIVVVVLGCMWRHSNVHVCLHCLNVLDVCIVRGITIRNKHIYTHECSHAYMIAHTYTQCHIYTQADWQAGTHQCRQAGKQACMITYIPKHTCIYAYIPDIHAYIHT